MFNGNDKIIEEESNFKFSMENNGNEGELSVLRRQDQLLLYLISQQKKTHEIIKMLTISSNNRKVNSLDSWDAIIKYFEKVAEC